MYKLLKSIFIVVFIGILLSSCGSKKKVVTTKRTPKTVVMKPNPIDHRKEEDKISVIKPSGGDKVVDYINDFKEVAMKEMQLYRIPASITLAQGILESGSGSGRLAIEANNHFGIKCHTGWTGGRIYHDDDEDQECFRTYNDASYSYRDHSLFLTDRKRYAGLFELAVDDYKAWAHGLSKAGYATDRRYPQKLIGLIERYELYHYDQMALGKEVDRPLTNNDIITETETQAFAKQHVVVKGDTLYSISKKYDLTVEQLKKINKLKSNELSIGKVLIVK